MTNIEEKLTQIECSGIHAVDFFSNEHKKDREWQVLGAVRRLLVAGGRGQDAPVFAEANEPPDFVAYISNAANEEKRRVYVEVVDVLKPGYKRDEFHKDDAKPNAPERYEVDPPLANPWEPLRQEIKKKALKHYERPILLIVYHTLPRCCFKARHGPFHSQILDEHRREPFVGVEAFDRALILNCDMQSLVELHPHPETIVPDIPFPISPNGS